MKESIQQQTWAKTPVANLVRYVPSGMYFARLRVGGKLIRKSLKTDRLGVAQLRLTDFAKEHRTLAESEERVAGGKMLFKDVLNLFRERLEANQRLKEGAKVYRRKCIETLIRTWPNLEQTPIAKITNDDCIRWGGKLAKEYSPSVYNNTVGTLRMVLAVAMEKGARYNNPALMIGKKRPTQKRLVLPSPENFQAFVQTIQTAGAWCSQDCARLVQFLAYGGCRKTEAANVTWADVDFEKVQILLRVTKNGERRYVPMIQEMEELLKGIRSDRPDEPGDAKVMLVQECQKAMDRAAKIVGMSRITHHDLRHLFATRCIESGVDVPTVSRWLGHKDGGALAMKVYGHLRDSHSTEQAAKVSFSTAKPVNVVAMPREASA